ncbi:hypothetical protein [Myxococcus sp. RHSTA-1-4]|uniref:hypothetical protein n=1 Tax=Myxococcus sp. RHSTA-1-4 TaxID=2874601 RepID=UPI001CC03118|nr:hypothetical protein [Myxococcus sp. RHSTA-1-4]MBZ4422663.1 hypothetical protein [Myxococcus sp. RHSTA-1-4]
MPTIRVMNWNIEQLSWNKIRIDGMATAIARTVVAEDIDILVLLEVKKTQVRNLMDRLTTALNAAARAAQNAQNAPTYTWFLSHETGCEFYGFIVRDLGLIRPLTLPAPAAGTPPMGTQAHPLTNLKAVRWSTWPNNNNWGQMPQLPNARPQLPLCNAFAQRPMQRAATRQNFGGLPLANGGYSLGRGYRMPGLALFKVHSPTSNTDYILPIVCCHYAAVRGSTTRNGLAQAQVAKLPFLHISQLYAWEQNLNVNRAQNPPPVSDYLDVDGQPVLVRNILFTGDFNIDFLQNANTPQASFLQSTNRNAYDALTPTQQQGGSANPAAQAGNAPQGNAPGVPFNPLPPAPLTSDILSQRLKAAVTTEATILRDYKSDSPGDTSSTHTIRGAAFDNFFYGGAQVRNATPAFGTNGVDSGKVVDIAANIVQTGAPLNAGQIDVSAIATHYATSDRTKDADLALNLQRQANTNHPLSVTDRWIGANLVSDHLPVVLAFPCP